MLQWVERKEEEEMRIAAVAEGQLVGRGQELGSNYRIGTSLPKQQIATIATLCNT